jgi:hypothetical protein
MSATEPGARPSLLGDKPSRFGKFIQTYHSFLSSFVIGAAGLIATSIWQYRQSEIAVHQAESQQRIAATQAENSWRIERAEILAKNLQTLSASGEGNVEQRYGVLLSLTRGNILDPELAVSYALELGKDNADYMKSVLASTADKSYARLASAFELTCQQRFGVHRDVPLCHDDEKHEDRSNALAELIADEIEAARKLNKHGPIMLLADEREVQGALTRLAWLFTPYLTDLYERRQWNEINWFEAQSTGARLVASVVLGPARPGEFVASTEAAEINKFHDERVRSLLTYLFSPNCSGECRSRVMDLIVTSYAEGQGRFDDALRQLLSKPRAEVASALARLHSRLLLCQVNDDDIAGIRDRVLVPTLAQEMQQAHIDANRLEDVLSLLALAPDPEASDDDAAKQAARKAWKQALDKVRSAENEHFQHAFMVRRASAQSLRSKPSPAVHKVMFCSTTQAAPAEAELDLDLDDE